MTLHPPFLLGLAILAHGPAFADEYIVDDQDGAPGFVTTGDDWDTWGSAGHGFDGSDSSFHYLTHTLGGSDRRGTATWQPTLSRAGTWQIDTWFRRTINRTRDANHVITDGLDSETWRVIDQYGEDEGGSASGWISLGEYWCEEGFGGCIVTLDGTDDDDSDEANAMRFTLVSAEPSSPESDPCDGPSAPGRHEIEFTAGSAGGTGWDSTSRATGGRDGSEAHSLNVDDGEVLWATDFDACDPEGEETIESVVLGVMARTQYDSGTYALELILDAGGASRIFTGTASASHEVDISDDRAWTWSQLAAVRAQVSLYDHPGGARDSDAWVDSFSLRVVYTTLPPDDDPGGSEEENEEESGDESEEESGDESGDGYEGRGSSGQYDGGASQGDGADPGSTPQEHTGAGCGLGLTKEEEMQGEDDQADNQGGPTRAVWLGLVFLGLRRRRA